MLGRARKSRNPFSQHVDAAQVEAVLNRLDSVDREAWAAAFSALGAPYEQQARAAEQAGDREAAQTAYLTAYEYWRVARYPAPNSPGKRAAYVKSQELFLKAGMLNDPPQERVEIPFRQARADEGDTIIALLRLPKNPVRTPVPVLIHWGGIDSFKEERRPEPYLKEGLATLAIDMPGVGDAPLAGSEDGERQWDAIFDWIGTRSELDADRVAILGGSTGGYWGTKVAHTHRERLRAAINQGGPAHYAFKPEWIARAQFGEYPFELAETLACAFGGESYDDWVRIAPRMSLLDQGILDRPCAPLLLVNGVEDSVFPIQDMYLLLEHGDPKSARFFPDTGHMGGSHATEIVVNWLLPHLLA